MTYLIVTIAIGLAFAFLVLVGNWIGEAIRRGAVEADRRVRLEELIKLKDKQAQEMLKDKTVEDVVRDLDAGEF